MEVDKLPKRHLILVGLPGAGKTTISRALSIKMNMPIIEVGSYVIAGANENVNFNNPLEFADYTFKKREYLTFVKKAFEQAKEIKGYAIISGPRLKEELYYLKENLGKAVSVGLMVEDRIREERRYLQLENEDQAGTLSKIRQRDQVEKSWGTDRTIELCDYRFDNHANMESTIRRIERILIAEGEENEFGF
jgi:Adenylate kinase and related kinases